MGYITAIAIIFVLYAFMHYFTELTKQQKVAISVTLFLFVLFAYLYNTIQAKEQERMYEIVTKYKQGKTIQCGNYEVNATNFDLSVGTYTFIGKENTPYYAIMISAYECK